MENQNEILDETAAAAQPATKADEAVLDNLASGQVEELTVATEGQYKPVAPSAQSPQQVQEQPAKQAIQLETPAVPYVAPPPVVVEEPSEAPAPMPSPMVTPSRTPFLHTVAGQVALIVAGAVAAVALYFLLSAIGM